MPDERDRPRPWRLAAPLRGLSAADLDELRARVGELPGAWRAVPHGDCEGREGEVSAVLMAEGDDGAAPTFVVGREGGLVWLDACRGDDYAHLGSYGTVARAVRAAAGALSDGPPPGR